MSLKNDKDTWKLNDLQLVGTHLNRREFVMNSGYIHFYSS